MKKKIFKYALNVTDFQKVFLPKGSEILTVQMQGGNPMLWAMMNPDLDAEMEERCIEMFGTGHDIPYDMGAERRYLGTVQSLAGSFVWHVFEYTGV